MNGKIHVQLEVWEGTMKKYFDLAKSFKKKEPIVLFNWTPNWVEAKYEGKFIEFPI